MSSFRPPQSLSASTSFDALTGPLEAELQGERAASLGRAGNHLEKMLARLSELDAADPARPAAVKAAAQAAWRYFVQREACRMLDHRQVIADYRIPSEVLVRVGAFD